MAIDRTNAADNIDTVSLQIELAKRTDQSIRKERTEKEADIYHDRLAEEEILMASGNVFERSNAQRLASIIAEKGRI